MVTSRIDSHADLLKKIDHYMDEQTKRSYSILVGIILCLITGVFSVGVATMNLTRSAPPAYHDYRYGSNELLTPLVYRQYINE